jgi:hypothetical protein
MENQTPKVYAAINAVQAALAKKGIGKDRKNDQQNYSFRGIDDVYNVLSPMLAEHHLSILPRVLERICTDRQSRNGGALFSVSLAVEFDIVCSDDASKHTVKVFGEAMDSADKATNKAMSAAYKYCAFMTFAIPVEGETLDTEKTDYKVKAGTAKSASIDKVKDQDFISAGERIAMKKVWQKAGKSDETVMAYLLEAYEANGTGQVKKKDYQEIMAWCAEPKPMGGA